MAQAHPETLWERARDAVVGEGLTYDQAASRVGIALSTLEKRAAAEDWMGQRRSHVQRVATYRQGVAQLKANMLQKATETLDPQAVHAWQAVERAFPEHRYGTVDEGEKRGIVAMVVEQLVAYFAAEDAGLLTSLQPHVRPLAEHLVKADWRTAA